MSDAVVYALAISNLVLAAGAWLAMSRMLKLRRQHRRAFNFRPYPIRKAKLDELDVDFLATPYGPSPDSVVAFVGSEGVMASVSDRETWVLGVLAKHAQRVFEFGTCSGKTTHVLAPNAPETAEVVTLTLHPDHIGDASFARRDDAHHQARARMESSFAAFYYTGRPTAAKIRQLFMDSKALDEAPYAGVVDMVFIDGAHTRSHVESDTTKALAMLRPGGCILWHDYKPDAPGVFGFLNELAKRLPLIHIKDTDLVFYRAPKLAV